MPEVHRIGRLQLEAGDAFQNFGFHTQMNALRIPVHDAYSSKDRQVTIVENGHGGQRHCPMQQVMLQPAETWIGKFCLWYWSIAPPPPSPFHIGGPLHLRDKLRTRLPRQLELREQPMVETITPIYLVWNLPIQGDCAI